VLVLLCPKGALLIFAGLESFQNRTIGHVSGFI
jgi:hypothetical protein